jgi:hypothetical protein
MCLDLFKKKLKFAFPEQQKGHGIFNNLNDLKYVWCFDYNVADQVWGLSLNVIIDDSITAPAWTVTDIIYIQSQWANVGVLAHEVAHVVYSLLEDRSQFDIEFNRLLQDKRIRLLSSKGKLSSPVENHAELYRYWGNQMPESLKPFYPKLI